MKRVSAKESIIAFVVAFIVSICIAFCLGMGIHLLTEALK